MLSSAASERMPHAARLRAMLPRGQTLPDDVWIRRHVPIVVFLALHAVALPIFALVQGGDVVHAFSTVSSLALLPGSHLDYGTGAG